MNKIGMLCALVLLAAGCGPARPEGAVAGCADTVAAVQDLWAGYPLPDYFLTEDPVKNGSEFDPNAYFTVLSALGMEPGYALDFVYRYDWLGGNPVLLARPEGAAPYLSWEEVPDPAASYLVHVQADGSAEGYFQLVVLEVMGGQFYLYWHANYNDLQIVCDRAALRAILDGISGGDFGLPMPYQNRVRALALGGLDPVVEIGDQTVEVRVVTFSAWAGFYEDTFTISRAFPHTVLGIEHRLLVPYDCGILF